VYAEQTRQKMEKQLHRRAKELGFEVKKIEPVSPTLVT
jgi:lipocalin